MAQILEQVVHGLLLQPYSLAEQSIYRASGSPSLQNSHLESWLSKILVSFADEVRKFTRERDFIRVYKSMPGYRLQPAFVANELC